MPKKAWIILTGEKCPRYFTANAGACDVIGIAGTFPTIEAAREHMRMHDCLAQFPRARAVQVAAGFELL